MNVFSQTQRYKALFWLSLFHLLVITSSNYLVQLPVSIFGFHTTWGAFSFPFIFLATDLTVRIFGAPLARRIIFAVMVPALACGRFKRWMGILAGALYIAYLVIMFTCFGVA